MSENIVSGNKSKSWVNVLSSILAGWNIFMILLFLLLILASAIISRFGGSVKFGSIAFYIDVAITGLISILASYYLARKIYMLLNKINDAYRYIVLASLILVTVLLFPSTFNYNI